MAEEFDPYYQWLGIPPKFQPPNHYRLLGIEEFESNPDVIENAADQRMQHLRTFQSGPRGEVSQKLLNEITAARLCLLNPAKKAEYDDKLKRDKAGEGPPRPQPTARAVRGDRAARQPQGVEPIPVRSPESHLETGIDASLPVTSSPLRGKRKSSRSALLQQAAIAGTVLGLLIVGAIFYVAFTTNDGDSEQKSVPVESNPSIAKRGNGESAIEPIKKPLAQIQPVQPEKSKEPGFDPRLVGRWVITYEAPKVVHTYEFRDDATAFWVEERRSSRCTKIGTSYLLDFGDGRVERVRLSGTSTLLVDHYFPGSDFAAGKKPSNVGRGVRAESSPGAVVRAGESVDFMKGINWSRDASGGNWSLEGGRVVKGQASPLAPAVLRLPHDCPAEYDFELVARRTSGDDALAVGLVFGDRRVVLLCDNANGTNTKLHSVKAPEPIYNGTLFSGNQPRRLVIQVRHSGITVLADKEAILTWRGIPAGLSVGPLWAKREIGDGLFLGIRNSAYQFDKLQLRPLDDDARPPGLVYVDELNEVDSYVGYGTLGKRGDRGYDNLKVVFLGRTMSHALSMHPPAKGTAHVTYNLNGAFRTFQAIAVLLDFDQMPESPVVFRVLGDGKLLWEKTIERHGQSESPGGLDVTDVKLLRLEVHCPGKNFGTHAAWLTPSLMPATSSEKSTQPAKRPPPAVAYLDDLRETDFRVGHGTLGKHGERGYKESGGKVRFQGRSYLHALSMHPRSPQPAYVTYQLDGQYASFQATAGLMDLEGEEKPTSSVTFMVWGDQNVLWTSKAIIEPGHGEFCAVDIQGVRTLKLEVFSGGGRKSAHHAVWLLPLVSRTPLKKSSSAQALAVGSEPAPEELKQAREQVRKKFKKEYAQARSPQQKTALAERLLEEGASYKSDTFKYALLDEAMQLAVALADFKLALRINDLLIREFDVDGAAKTSELFKRLAAEKLTAQKRNGLVESALEAAEELLNREKFNMASDLAALAEKTATSEEQKRQAKTFNDRVETFRNWWTDKEKAERTLEKQPDDPNANWAMGRYLCFAQDEWEEGLPHLAKCDDDKLKLLKEAAEFDLKAPLTAEAQAEAGDAWRKFAASAAATGLIKTAAQRRAQQWYQQALPELKGTAKTAVGKHLKALDKALGDAGDARGAFWAKQLIGDFYLTASTPGGTKSNTTYRFEPNGSVLDNNLPVGKWSRDRDQIVIKFDNADEGMVRLRGRDKNTFRGEQTSPKGQQIDWDLRRVVPLSEWLVYNESHRNAKPNRLVLYSNGKANDIYGRSTWSRSGNQLTIRWADYRLPGISEMTVQGTFTIDAGEKTFSGRAEDFTWKLRGVLVGRGGGKK